MRMKIFSCHHAVAQDTIMTDLFSSLISGVHGTQDYLGDLDGDNIASDNDHSEMRHQYYVWKNLLHRFDYVGFEHYRRVLFTDIQSASVVSRRNPELLIFRGHFAQSISRPYLCASHQLFSDFWMMRKTFSVHDILDLKAALSKNDITLTRPLFQDREAMAEQWKTSLPEHVWNIMIEAAMETELLRNHPLKAHMRIETPSFFNMYVMRSDLFSDYMEFYFEVIRRIRHKVEPTPRLWGHCAERLINIFVYARSTIDPNIRVGNMPFILKTSEYIEPQK
ncbi:DUF4422 domain-containing protein [Acetobacter thailandicus]|uniref:DUF4422 domain-containing protein n=4 Tax=Acetobacter TaxID=434 RepID=UPI000A3D61AA|nr:DUF4422 domain-containing protein [Acetobacter thailandicus]OUJ10497.1 hypothetical protein HK25_06640 [Acetobacter sp. DsW_059]